MDNLKWIEKVSVIIPSYNRFKYLLNTIHSIRNQTYKNIEIIVVNDGSTEKEYYEYPFEKEDIKIIHLEENSKTKFGFGCPQRNFGIEKATGKYIAFCDDDDIWFPQKIELQLEAMRRTGCKMSCTEGLIGNGVFNKNKPYKKYNEEHYFHELQDIYRRKGSQLLENGFPEIWNLDFLQIHNCIICSSVIIEKEIIDKTGAFIIANTSEDYDYWLRVLQYTNSVYVNDICFYYDLRHGNGQNY
jgi:glycosyltransferase involved in cell wall biosynthesis